MTRVMGTVVSINGDQMVVKPESGDNIQVKVPKDARIRKDRSEAKLSDFKPGDRVVIAGEEGSNKVLTARFVAGGEMVGRGGRMSAPPSPEEMVKMGLGTKFIAGEVKSIEGTKLTILRPDGQTQTIEVDENTSFRNSKGEDAVLPEVKVGDHVMGRGEIKNGVFVPQILRFTAQPGPGGMSRQDPGKAPDGGPVPKPEPK